LRAAAEATGRWRLDGCTLVVALEPWVMCAGALVGSRIARLVYGAFDEKAGAVGSIWDIPRDRAALHHPEVYAGVRAEESAALLREFFTALRG
ncbi:nucleoside deaminase, partial [Burkholderia multivorans]